MPRNRSGVEKHLKVEEILAAAERALRASPQAELTVHSIAKELGVRRGSIHWYFKTQHSLFVAAATRIFESSFVGAPPRSSPGRRIEWAVEKLADLQPVIRVLHVHARVSPEAAALEARLEEGWCMRVREILRPKVNEKELESVAQVVVVFIEGLLARPMAPTARKARLRFVMKRLLRTP